MAVLTLKKSQPVAAVIPDRIVAGVEMAKEAVKHLGQAARKATDETRKLATAMRKMAHSKTASKEDYGSYRISMKQRKLWAATSQIIITNMETAAIIHRMKDDRRMNQVLKKKAQQIATLSLLERLTVA